MKGGKEPSVLEKIKQEIIAQEEGVSEVLELTFESIKVDKFTTDVAKLFQKYDKLVSLEFSECDIKSLDGFPQIPGLIKLSLESNQLTDDSLRFIGENFKELQFLSLTANNIKSLEGVKQLAHLTQLVQLDLQDNPISEVTGYRQSLFASCKSLEILDNKDKDGQEVKYSDDDEDDEDDENDGGEIDNDYDDADQDDDDDDEDDEDDDLEPQPQKKRQ